MIVYARKIPKTIRTVQWTGSNVEDIRVLTTEDFFRKVDLEFEITAQVYDRLHDTWVGVKTGDWIIEGVEGEFYPCDNGVFEKTYEVRPR